MIDINEIENKGDWTNDYKVKLFWELVTEVKRLREGIEKALIPTDKVPWAHELFKLSGLRDALKELIE